MAKRTKEKQIRAAIKAMADEMMDGLGDTPYRLALAVAPELDGIRSAARSAAECRRLIKPALQSVRRVVVAELSKTFNL